MKTILNKYPKAFNKYKEWLKNNMKDKYPSMENIDELLTDDLIIAGIIGSPYTCAEFFDTVNLIGTYTHYEDGFAIYVNSNIIKNKKGELLSSSNRKEIEETLIKYLFMELEKTL